MGDLIGNGRNQTEEGAGPLEVEDNTGGVERINKPS